VDSLYVDNPWGDCHKTDRGRSQVRPKQGPSHYWSPAARIAFSPATNCGAGFGFSYENASTVNQILAVASPDTIAGQSSVTIPPGQTISVQNTLGTTNYACVGCYNGNVVGPGSTTIGNVAQYSSASGYSLGAGLPVAASGHSIPVLDGNNQYSGTSTFKASLFVPTRVITASGAVTVSASLDYHGQDRAGRDGRQLHLLSGVRLSGQGRPRRRRNEQHHVDALLRDDRRRLHICHEGQHGRHPAL
jgi:hypothetical protein